MVAEHVVLAFALLALHHVAVARLPHAHLAVWHRRAAVFALVIRVRKVLAHAALRLAVPLVEDVLVSARRALVLLQAAARQT